MISDQERAMIDILREWGIITIRFDYNSYMIIPEEPAGCIRKNCIKLFYKPIIPVYGFKFMSLNDIKEFIVEYELDELDEE